MDNCAEWAARIRARRDVYGRLTSVVMQTRYGSIVFYEHTPGRIEIRLVRRGFVRPTPHRVYLCCSKHTNETREAKGGAAEVEQVCCCYIERGARADLEEILESLLAWCAKCESCKSCGYCEWEKPGLEYLDMIDWEVVGASVHPSPPQAPLDCYAWIRDRWGQRAYWGDPRPCLE